RTGLAMRRHMLRSQPSIDRTQQQIGRAMSLPRSLLEFFYLGARDVAVRAALEVRVQVVEVVHHRLARRKAYHSLVEAAVSHRLNEVLLADRLEAFQQRRPDETFLIRAMAAIARRCAPCAKAV